MAVEDVYKPTTLKSIDPRAANEKEDGSEDYWAKKARGAKNRLDYQEYEHAMRQLGQTPEPPFKVQGSVNLGNIDLQAQQNQAQERTDKLLDDKDKEIKDERERAKKAEQDLQAVRLDALRSDFDHRLDDIKKTIEQAGNNSRKDDRPLHEQFKEQFTALRDLAKELGLEKTSAGRDPTIDIELAKMTYQQAREEREFKRQMRNDEKQWQVKMQELQDKRAFDKAELEQKARRDNMIASFPEQIGAAWAKGQLDREAQGPVSQRPTNQRLQQQAFQAPEGAQGQAPCPNCQSPLEIAATTTLARCLNCNSQFPVIRTAPQQPDASATGPEPYQQEEEEE